MLKHHTLSLSEISTVGASFADDLGAYHAAGFDGIGIWEMKLGDDAADLTALEASSLRVTNCVPLVPSILPNGLIAGPEDVDERVEALCDSIRRLARYEPEAVLCLTGAAGGRPEAEARRLVVEGLRRLAEAAASAGVRLALEPVHPVQRDALSLVTSIPEAIELLEEADVAHVGLLVDLWHLGHLPSIERDLGAHVARIAGLHVAEPDPAAVPERALPGKRAQELVALLTNAGWGGSLDVEIFGVPEEPSSFWALPPDEAARRAYDAAVGVLP
ncbi:MAG TPA: TIM barrel protein [Gaiellaceae bacterium]|nr:TIM barrel protein [Gaiellaceae bacterium]